jgi:two-component sensor histidine kinase
MNFELKRRSFHNFKFYSTVLLVAILSIQGLQAHEQKLVTIAVASAFPFSSFYSIFIPVIIFSFVAVTIYFYRIINQKNRELIEKDDIISEKDRLLDRLNREREWLLKEIHHRVKNNLHTIFSLLESQATYLKDDALNAIEMSQHRVYAMSLIHKKLYRRKDLGVVDVAGYLNEFVRYLYQSFGSPSNINIKLDVAALDLPVTQAVPVGLIINEALTNALKYAFPDHTNGIIRINIQQFGNRVKLVIADNGIGLPEGYQLIENTLGMGLMNGLAGEMDGEINITCKKGTTITVWFDQSIYEPIQETGIKDEAEYLNR